jgi:integral membrane protein
MGGRAHDLGEWITTYLGIAHGYLYMVFLVMAALLARQARWSIGFTIATLLLGTVPFASFYAERLATARTRALMAASAYPPPPPPSSAQYGGHPPPQGGPPPPQAIIRAVRRRSARMIEGGGLGGAGWGGLAVAAVPSEIAVGAAGGAVGSGHPRR